MDGERVGVFAGNIIVDADNRSCRAPCKLIDACRVCWCRDSTLQVDDDGTVRLRSGRVVNTKPTAQ